MTIEQARQMIEELENVELEHYENKMLILLKWKKRLAQEESKNLRIA